MLPLFAGLTPSLITGMGTLSVRTRSLALLLPQLQRPAQIPPLPPLLPRRLLSQVPAIPSVRLPLLLLQTRQDLKRNEHVQTNPQRQVDQNIQKNRYKL